MTLSSIIFARMSKVIVAPSVLSADFGNLERDIQLLNSSEAEWIHIDVMDGVFVPNISFGFPVIKAIHKYAKKPLDVHQELNLFLGRRLGHCYLSQ